MSTAKGPTAYLVDKNTGAVEGWTLMGRGRDYAVLEREQVAVTVALDSPQECVCLSVSAVAAALRLVVKRKARCLERAQGEQRLAQDRLSVWATKARNEAKLKEIKE